jgi:hypothetical protein
MGPRAAAGEAIALDRRPRLAQRRFEQFGLPRAVVARGVEDEESGGVGRGCGMLGRRERRQHVRVVRQRWRDQPAMEPSGVHARLARVIRRALVGDHPRQRVHRQPGVAQVAWVGADQRSEVCP